MLVFANQDKFSHQSSSQEVKKCALPGETHAGKVVVGLEGESVKIGALQKEPTKDNYITNREQEYSYGVKIKLLTT